MQGLVSPARGETSYFQTPSRQLILGFKRLVRITDRGNPDGASLCSFQLLSQNFGCIDFHVYECTPGLFMPRVPLHEETSIAVPAIDLASRVWVDAVIEDLGLVEDAFGLGFFDG